MRKKNWKKILAVSLLVTIVLTALTAVPQMAKAGFGDFDSHSDFGGSSRHRSGGDSGDLDLSELIRFATFFGELLGIKSPLVSILLMVFVIVVLKIVFSLLRGKSQGDTEHKVSDYISEYKPETLDQLRTEDPDFDPEALVQRVKILFERMQACWEDGNIEPLRKDFMPDTWTRFNTQLQNKKAAGETSHVRGITFGEVILQSYTKDAEHQVLRLRIDVTHNVWTTDRRGKCIQGNEKTRKRFKFAWTMMRPLGSRTGGAAPEDTAHCPNCGAEIDLEAFAECPFCHTPLMNISQDWVISEIDALSQKTLHQ